MQQFFQHLRSQRRQNAEEEAASEGGRDRERDRLQHPQGLARGGASYAVPLHAPAAALPRFSSAAYASGQSSAQFAAASRPAAFPRGALLFCGCLTSLI